LPPGVFLQHGTIAALAGHLKDLNVSLPARGAATPDQFRDDHVDVAHNVRELLAGFLINQLQIPSDELDPDTSLLEYGIDSVVAVKLAHTIEDACGVKLSH